MPYAQLVQLVRSAAAKSIAVRRHARLQLVGRVISGQSVIAGRARGDCGGARGAARGRAKGAIARTT
eukprot:1394471-Lingulodinium_polyedra.AAC.1